ncbi:TPA: VirK family protein [Legionella pneumophila]|uniref:VirK protein n=1 Tax=Legionella pneumophila subsp. pneumophila TaxID=91891 RepID=A0A3A6VWB7_LEGPN|nr:VirK family protein [Legionella pneumophila]ERH45589.1 VirK protein [Legionella pneumophila str. Leg01/53]ERH45844.1 VirK protein [Legionella pneumophila str. Leg01/11]ERI49028.1 VirK protein [Legionella pneumophila str. Leg01/20]AMQ28101.1 VirK protein [Legionella pneumophila subsp. pneumophila]AMV14581.1 VirK protein [Legionella pneumophila]
MKKMFLAVFTLCSFTAQAAVELKTFQNIVDAIAEGKRITFVISLKKCTSEMPLSSAIVSVTPNAVMVVGDNRVTASDRHFTLDDPVARGTPMFDYSKFNLDSEGDASIKTTVLNASSYERLGSYQMNCKLGDGFKVFG